jgi:hypothetical protein
MYYQKLSNKPFKSLCLSFSVSILIACNTTPEYKAPSFDPVEVKKMAFKFENSAQFLDVTLPQTKIGKNVTSNLSEWGYQFIDKQSEGYTHDLSIHLGSISRGSTPPGFSFTSGNSNPRALDFQKASILPITCSLMSKGHQQQRAELIMEVLASEYKGNSAITVSEEKMINCLTDDISTTCYNLLSSLHVQTLQKETPAKTIKPKWIPEIRIEIENEAEAVDIKTAVPVENKAVENNVLKVSSTVKENSAPKENAIEKERKLKIIKEAPRKRIIIHNQGSPVIFKFGHERQ